MSNTAEYYKNLLTGDDNHKSEKTSRFSKKEVGVAMALCLILILFVLGIFFIPRLFKATDEKGIVTFSYHSSLITGTTMHVVPILLQDSILPLIKKGTQVFVSFKIENGNDSYSDIFKIGDTILKISQTQDRKQYFVTQKLPELLAKIAAYEKALQAKPFRAFAIAVDVTEGYHGNFRFADYLSQSEVAWLSDPTKESSLFVYAIGYNPIPGFLSWKHTQSIGDMECAIQQFLEPVKKELPSTALFSQIHFIMNEMAKYHMPSIVIKSDMLENTADLSAYRSKDQAYKDFISKNAEFIQAYQKKAVAAAELQSIASTMSGDVKVILVKDANTALGRTTGSHSWYTATENYLKDAYPKVNFIMNY